MGSRSSIAGLAAIAAAGVILVFVGLSIRQQSKSHRCDICGRPIHPETRTVAFVDGARREFCCPSCALSDQLQTGKSVEIIELTDFETHAAIDPEEAVLVRGSSVNPCLGYELMVDREKQPITMSYDRCSPGVIAFADIEAARRFVQKHGGTIIRISGLP